MSSPSDRPAGTLRIRVTAFALAAELLGTRRLDITVPASVGTAESATGTGPATTVGDVLAEVVRRHPKLAPLLPRLRTAVGEEYVPPTHVVPDGAEVVLIPPVSGGLPVG